MSPNKIARIAGVLYLSMIPMGIFGILYVPSTIIVPGDIAATLSNILANEMTFRLSIITALMIQIVQIFLVYFLYQLFKSVNQMYAQLMVILILVAVPIAMLNEANLLAVLHLADKADQAEDLISLFLDLHKHGILIAQIFWGLWLFPMGYLAFKSGFIPKIIGILLMIGCFGYLGDSVSLLLFPDLGVTFSEYTFIGEVLLPLWLLIKGVTVTKKTEM